MTCCTGLSVRAWRELIKTGAVHTVTEDRGRGRIRLCDATCLSVRPQFQHLTGPALAWRCLGGSPISCRSIRCFMLFGTSYESLQGSTDVDFNTRLPPATRNSRKPIWFDPDKPAKPDPQTDWLVEIYDVVLSGHHLRRKKTSHRFYGDLRNEGTSFIAWFPFIGDQTSAVQANNLRRHCCPTESTILSRNGKIHLSGPTGSIPAFSIINTRNTARITIPLHSR